MAGGKETGRQKMIGMMYLVLTALLAMNVSKEILQSFVVINKALEITNENFNSKNQTTYNLFDKAEMNDKTKVKPFNDKAKQIKGMADELDVYINDLKKMVIAYTEGHITNAQQHEGTEVLEEVADSLLILNNASAKDNYDKPTEMMLGSDEANPKTADIQWSALQLKGKIEDYREKVRGILVQGVGEERAAQVNLGLELGDVPTPEKNVFDPWEMGYFYHLPLAAVVTNLTKFQTDIRNAEADAVKALYGNISADDFKFDKLDVKVIPSSNYVILGDSFSADVFVAAYSTTQNPVLEASTSIDTTGGTVKIVGDPDADAVTVANGVGQYRVKPTSEGLVEWGGVIKIKKPNGEYAPYSFKHEYMVAKPTLVVSPTAMNVFYRGLDNPVEVSVPGVPTEQLNVNISNGAKSSGKGKFTVKPGKGKTCVVSVSADLNGTNKSFGKMEFRVKNVPDPKPYFAGITGSGNVQLKKLKAAQGVLAKMENFEFDLKFNVISFVMSATVKGKVVDQKSNGGRVTGNMKTLINSMRPGSKLYIEKIKARGPDGSVRDLGTVVLKVI